MCVSSMRRLAQLRGAGGEGANAFRFHEVMLEDAPRILEIFAETRPDAVIHLAAQAGVRYSLENPRAYIDSNLTGTFNVMEGGARDAAGSLPRRLDELRLWREHADALRRDASDRSPDHALCRHQEGQRDDAACLCASVESAGHDVSLLHRLRPLGTARHGPVQIRQGDSRGYADRRLWRGADEA